MYVLIPSLLPAMLGLPSSAIVPFIQGVFSGPLLPRQAPFDLQAHRGGRGETVENTWASFAWFGALCYSARSLAADD